MLLQYLLFCILMAGTLDFLDVLSARVKFIACSAFVCSFIRKLKECRAAH